VAHEHNSLYKLESHANIRKQKKTSSLEGKIQRGPSADSSQKDMGVIIHTFTSAANKACSQLPLEVLHARLRHTSMSNM